MTYMMTSRREIETGHGNRPHRAPATEKRGPLQREVEETIKVLGSEFPNVEPHPSGEDGSDGSTGEEETEETVIRAVQTETLEVPIHIDLQDGYIMQVMGLVDRGSNASFLSQNLLELMPPPPTF